MLMKRYAKWAGITVLTPLVLILLLSILLYLPPVQNWAVKQVAAYASESTGMDISVKQVRLVFPLKLGVEGVKVLQPIDSLKNSPNLALRNKRDTVADIQKMVVDVQLLPLFESQVMVDELNFTQMKVNTTNFIHEARIKGNVEIEGMKVGKEGNKIVVPVDSLLVWSIANAKTISNNYGEIKIDKDITTERIDPIDAIIDAWKHAMKEEYRPDVNETVNEWLEQYEKYMKKGGEK